MDDYPARPKNFLIKFGKLLLTVRAGNRIGAEAYALLNAIAFAEDSNGWSGPVSLPNIDLRMISGIESDKRLLRARDKAAEAGWLAFTKGSKWTPSQYWVLVPAGFAAMLGRSPVFTLPLGDRSEADSVGSNSPTAGDRRLIGDRGEIDRSSIGGRDASLLIEDLPNPRPVPVPEPVLAESAERPRRARAKPTPDKTAGGDQKPRPRNELFDAVAEVCGADPTLNGSQVGKAAADLARAGYTPADVRAFAARLVEFCPWAKDRPHRRPEVGELVKHIGKIRTAGRPVTAAPVPPEQQPGFDPKLGFVPTPGFKYRNPLTED